MEPEAQDPQAAEAALELDQNKVDLFMLELEDQQNIAMGTVAGTAAAIVGAVIWGLIAYVTEYSIGWIAIGVGCVVGFSVRRFGKGLTAVYGIVGAVLAFVGVAGGNFLTVVFFAAKEADVSVFTIMSYLSVEDVVMVMKETFQVMDLLFYGLAIYEGYRFSIRTVNQEELAALVKRDPAL